MRRPLSLIFVALALAVFPRGAQGQFADPDSLVLRPGDVVRVEIWLEKDLSGDFHVDTSGDVVLPLLGAVKASGRTWAQLRRDLLAGYARELRNPSVRLTPLRRVHVMGQVNQAGIYAVDPTLTLLGALALAGGVDPEGDLKNIRVVRSGEVILDRVPAESALAVLDVRSGDQVFVGRRSWFDRNSTFLATAVLSAASIVVTIFAR